ncbi:hypothetical protein [Amycolatopsis magusensis]|uniref:hypothetical protein n=1 Tax=Amycolatopsis magusensis TaxID=882444 RepID=UPI0037AAF1AC
MFVHEPGNSSILGRLLEEISWEGDPARRYRDGGRGRENVLSAEVLTVLDYLPRAAFLGAVLRGAHGDPATLEAVAGEAEELQIEFLPEEVQLNPRGVGRAKLIVQPDAFLRGPGTFTLVEARGLRAGVFRPEQLAREYLALTARAGSRTPLLLLILGAPPPVSVAGHGKLAVAEAIDTHLDTVHARAENHPWSLSTLREELPRRWAWTTWSHIAETVTEQNTRVDYQDPSVAAAASRMVTAVSRALHWHR